MTAAKSPERIALVTGANRGIGVEVCRQLAARGWRVLLGARDLAKGQAAAAPSAAACARSRWSPIRTRRRG